MSILDWLFLRFLFRKVCKDQPLEATKEVYITSEKGIQSSLTITILLIVSNVMGMQRPCLLLVISPGQRGCHIGLVDKSICSIYIHYVQMNYLVICS